MNKGQHSDAKARVKIWIKLVLTYLFVPLLLLLIARDIAWWQGWLFYILFCIIGVGSRVLAEKKHPGLMVERGKFGYGQNVKTWDKILAPLMAISLSLPLFIVAGLDHYYQWTPTLPLWLNLLGFMLIISGYVFASWAVIENQFFSSVTRIQYERGHKVCDRGPYSVVRHPGYAGNISPLIGMALALNSMWVLCPAIIALAVIVIRTVLEDKTLKEELPGYKAYMRNVRYRLIPGIF